MKTGAAHRRAMQMIQYDGGEDGWPMLQRRQAAGETASWCSVAGAVAHRGTGMAAVAVVDGGDGPAARRGPSRPGA